MVKKPKISLFIPVYNEEKILDENVRKVIKKMDKVCKGCYKIIIMDDSSTDQTSQIARNLAKSFKQIRYIRYEDGPSRRENLLKSFKEAKGDLIAYIDADLSTDLSCMEKLVDFPDVFDLAIGSRYISGSKIKRTFKRRVVSYLLNRFVRIYFGSRLKDHFSGFKVFKKGILDILIEETGIGNRERGMFWDAEMLVRAQRNNFRIRRFPVIWTEGEKTSLNFKREFKMIPYALKLKWRL